MLHKVRVWWVLHTLPATQKSINRANTVSYWMLAIIIFMLMVMTSMLAYRVTTGRPIQIWPTSELKDA